MIAFDLDGCLIDSEELIRQSYKDVGVELPDGFMSRPSGQWADDDLRARKDAAYLHRLATDPLWPLPPWWAAEVLHEAGEVVGLITSAPDGAVQVVAKRALSWPFTVTCAGLTPTQKAVWLNDTGPGVYVDDQEHVVVPPSWRFIHYTGQDADELVRLITCP